MRSPENPGRSIRRLLLLAIAAGLLLGSAAIASEESPGEPDSRTGHAGETVILLHGLGRGAGSMSVLEEALSSRGLAVRNLDYPSRESRVEELLPYVARAVEACCTDPPARVHFVTHSLGGILVRAYILESRPPDLGRVVMLAPPNRGTVLVDAMRDNPAFQAGAGPAATQLGTDAGSVPNRLGPVDFELGVIAGDRSWNPLGSWLIPGEDDGTVAVESARIEGMADFRVVPATHTFIMRHPEAVQEVLHFLEHGRFRPLPE